MRPFTNSRSTAVAAVILLLLPMGPVTATASIASAACDDEACRVLPLYVQTAQLGPNLRGLSALSGDAMPTDARSRVTGGFSAATPSLDFDLTLAKADSFIVNLSSPTEADHVEGTIRVLARDLHGNDLLLARADFTAPDYEPTPAEYLSHTLQSADVPPFVPTLIGSVGPAWNTVRTITDGASSPASTLATNAYGVLCGSYDSMQCRQVTGRYGPPGALDVCASAPPQNNILAGLVWTGVSTADATQSALTGTRVCGTPASGYVNDSAADTDGALAPVFDAIPDLDEVQLWPNSTPPAPHTWRRIELNATAPAALPQTDTSLTLPQGMQLVLEVRLDAVQLLPNGSVVRTPVLFEMGRQDTPTYLAIRTPTPHAFSGLAYGREWIGPGLHTGFFSNATDIDDYAFDVAPGWGFALGSATGGIGFTVYDPDGRLYVGTNASVVSHPGRWTLRVSDAAPVSASEYAFHLEIGPPSQPEHDHLHIGEGVHAGDLGPGDDVDTWFFHAWLAQRLSIRLEHDAADRFRLKLQPGDLWDVNEVSAQDSHEITGRADLTGFIVVQVSRAYGAGAYTLALDLDEAGNHTSIPEISRIWSAEDTAPVTGLAGYQGGVEFVRGGALLRVLPDNQTFVLGEALEGDVARRADGAIVARSGQTGASAIVIAEDAGPNPALIGGGSFAFGPNELVRIVSGRITVLSPERVETHVPFGVTGGQILFHPDGLAIIHDPSGQSYAFDGEQGWRAPEFDGVSAFDAEGRGYRVLKKTLVERLDPEGPAVVVAHAPRPIRDLAFSGNRLFASLEGGFDGSTSTSEGIGVVELAVEGFEGFHPSFPLSPAPNLVPAGFEDVVESVGLHPFGPAMLPAEDHVLKVRVRNDGGGSAAAFNVTVSLQCNSCTVANRSYFATQTVGGLDAGESTTLEFRWNAAGHAGDQTFRVDIDQFPNVLAETNESDNAAEYTTWALVGGQDRLCRALVGDATLPITVQGASGLRAVCRVIRA